MNFSKRKYFIEIYMPAVFTVIFSVLFYLVGLNVNIRMYYEPFQIFLMFLCFECIEGIVFSISIIVFFVNEFSEEKKLATQTILIDQ